MLLVDSTFISRGFGGIAQDNRVIVSKMHRHPEISFLYDKAKRDLQINEFMLEHSLKFINKLALAVNRPVSGFKWNGNFFQTHLTGLRTPSTGGTTFLRMHDIFPLTNPEWFTQSGIRIFSLAARNIQPNTVLICNSESTRAAVKKHEYFTKFEALLLPCEVSNTFLSDVPCAKCEICQHGILKKNFLLAVGTVEPRKNYTLLLDAWQIARRKSSFELLIIVGRPGWKHSKIKKRLVSDDGVLWQSPCNYSLVQLYKSAGGFISSSLAEGFNLPIMEARMLGLKCALSDIAVHKELHPEAEIFFNPVLLDSIVMGILGLEQVTPRKQIPNLQKQLSPSFQEILKIMLDE